MTYFIRHRCRAFSTTSIANILIFCISIFVSDIGVAGTWPKLIPVDNASECSEALKIADAMFYSSNYVLYAPPIITAEIRSKLVVGPKAIDISGGDALEADQDVFEKIPIPSSGSPRSIYWQKEHTDNYRLLIQEIPVGWRGDMYSTFTIGTDISPSEFLANITERARELKYKPFIAQSWRPPVVLYDGLAEKLWLIDVEEPYGVLGAWKIYVSEPEGFGICGIVQFGPNVSSALELLPTPVRKLAELLNQSLGAGENEGTLRPTARLRGDAAQTWANAALRPWALVEPYNTRGEVDLGLEDWSRRGKSYRKLYLDILKQYRLSEPALGEYYKTNFHKTSEGSKLLAAYSLDIMFRSYFAFHSNDSNSYFRHAGEQYNPWREDQ